MIYFDTHAHIGLIHEDKINRRLAVSVARTKGLRHILCVTNTIGEAKEIYSDLETMPEVSFAVGVSPCDIIHSPVDWQSQITDMVANSSRTIAIGESGLDFVKGDVDHDKQIAYFLGHIKLANRLGLPLIIHNRQAGEEIQKILSSNVVSKGAVMHCYGENYTWAKKMLDKNLMFSFAGNITYKEKDSQQIRECASKLPIDRILVESESPFMAPASIAKRAQFTTARGGVTTAKKERNQPSYLPEVILEIAKLRNEDPEELSGQIYQNSLNFFGVKD